MPVKTKPNTKAKAGAKADAKPKSLANSLIELGVIVAVAVGLAFLVQAFVVKPYRIPSGSMEPTLAIGQRVLVDRIGTHFGSFKIGEIVVFHPPEGSGQGICGPTPHEVQPGGAACSQTVATESSETYIKRIVGGPGDWLYIKNGDVYLSTKGRQGPFKREHAPYILPCGDGEECNFPTPIHIAAGHWFMMGDHRGDSEDSRFWGPVRTSWIIGAAFATYWPPDRIGFF